MTDIVVSSTTNNVVATTNVPASIATLQIDKVVSVNEQTSVVTLSTTDSVLVEQSTNTVVVTGLLGPPGVAGISEDDVVYSKRIDFITDNDLYRGEAAVGSIESSPTWRIRRIVLANDGDVQETWASGTANFDKSWTDRSTYLYI